MTVYLDDRPMEGAPLAAEATVEQAIAAARRSLGNTDQLIVSVRCDGREVPAAGLDDVLVSPVARFGRVQLVTASVHELVTDALRDGRRLFQESFPLCREAATALGAGRVAEAMTKLVECAGIWSVVHESVVRGGSLLRIDFDRVEIDGRPISESLGRLTTTLREIRHAISAQDLVLLGDLLRYEVDETLQGWERLLEGVAQHVQHLPNRRP